MFPENRFTDEDIRKRFETFYADSRAFAKERKNEFEISRIRRFRYRTRYFTDSGIIGSKKFVSRHYQRFKHLFYSNLTLNAKLAFRAGKFINYLYQNQIRHLSF
jgi:hypothetical protein